MSHSIASIRKWIVTSPPVEWAINKLRETLIGALSQGPIPQHVAFVMDGNRRFARTHKIETVEGHNLGFEALVRILEVCYKSGVKVITVYAFSIENFKRSKKEVDALMEICKVKLVQISRHGDLLDMYGAKIQILGNRDLVKQDVLDAIDHAVEMTSKNTDTILNVCFPYTSRDEMATAIRNTVEDYSKSIRAPSKPLLQTRLAAIPETPVESPMHDDADDSVSSSSTLHPDSPPQIIIQEDDSPYLDPESITEATIEEHLFTAGNPPLDLLVRTSGVKRLSDFMLWQCHERTEIVFLDVLWPEFDLWHFLPILVEWQWRRKYAQIKEHAPVTSARPTKTIKVR